VLRHSDSPPGDPGALRRNDPEPLYNGVSSRQREDLSLAEPRSLARRATTKQSGLIISARPCARYPPPPLPPPTPPQTDGLPEMWPSAWFAPQTRASNAYVCPERRMRQLAPSTTQTKQKHGSSFQHRVRRSLSAPLKAAPELNRSHVCFLAASRVAGVHLHLVGWCLRCFRDELPCGGGGGGGRGKRIHDVMMLFERARYLLVVDSLTPVCSDSCRWAKDAVCQDGGLGTNFSSGPGCDFGTDCTDCGSRRMGDDPTAGMIDYDIALLRHFYGSNYSGISSAIVARMNRVANDTLDTARPKWEDAEFS
jgi:hypothetical protein